MLVKGRRRLVESAEEGLKIAYENEETDEFVKSTVIERTDRIRDGETIVFFNFRPDRARQLTQVFIDKSFHAFPTLPLDVWFTTLTRYDDTFCNPVAFETQHLTNTLGEVISLHDLQQLRIAETEKYAHITYFFNGGRETPFEGESRCLIQSPKVTTYDLKPEMAAYAVTKEVINRIKSKKYDVIILNYANADMVGHTGSWNATIKAVEVVDECIGRVVKEMLAQEGIVLITSDHGNADEMMESDEGPKTSHSTNPVPFIIVGKNVRLRNGILGDVAPTILELLHIKQPEEMTRASLISS